MSELNEENTLKVYIDLSGETESEESNNYGSVPDDAYTVKCEKVEHFVNTKYKSELKELKLRFYFRIVSNDKYNDVLIPFFCTPVIRRVRKEGFSNSKLFDVLTNLELIELVAGHLDYLTNLNNLVDWLDLKLKDRKIKVITKKVNKNTEKEYSRVADIVRFEE